MLSINVINILILFFIFLIFFQIFLAFSNNSIREGLITGFPPQAPSQYQPYNTNDPNNALILAQQNAGNIQVLKQQLDELMKMKQQVQDISGNVDALQKQVSGMVGAQQQYAQDMTPSSPPQISGAVN
jgi:hypothetical protein